MPKAIDSSRSIAAAPVSIERTEKRSTRSRTYELVSIALFSGIGLLITLVAIILGVQGSWY